MNTAISKSWLFNLELALAIVTHYTTILVVE